MLGAAQGDEFGGGCTSAERAEMGGGEAPSSSGVRSMPLSLSLTNLSLLMKKGPPLVFQ
jgi:hypothetical protein